MKSIISMYQRLKSKNRSPKANDRWPKTRILRKYGLRSSGHWTYGSTQIGLILLQSQFWHLKLGIVLMQKCKNRQKRTRPKTDDFTEFFGGAYKDSVDSNLVMSFHVRVKENGSKRAFSIMGRRFCAVGC